MLVVDASVLVELVADTPEASRLRERLVADADQHAPHLIDAEVLSAIERKHRAGALDATRRSQAIADLQLWPGERWSHRILLPRAWELRHNVRSYDALYVALAEALDAPLITLDRRLVTASGPRCQIEVPS